MGAATAGAAALAACAAAPAAPVPAAPAVEEPAAPEQEAPTAAPAAETVTVRWLTRAVDWGGQEAGQEVPKLVEQYFYPEHPDIKVVVEPAGAQWEEKLLTAMVAGDAPDVFEAWPDIFNNWAERDLILDLQPYVDRDISAEEAKDYIPAQWARMIIQGIRVGMPLYVDLRLDSYNKDLFDKAGVAYPPRDGNWTVDDYVNTAAKLTLDLNGDGEADQWGTLIENGGWFYWVRMWGGDIVSADDPTKCLMGSDESQAAYNFIWDNQWRKKPNVFAQPAQVQNGWYYEAWVPEIVAMAQKGCYPGRTVREVGGKFKWNYAHPPKGPKGHKTLVDADAWAIWKGTKVPDAAWDLVHFNSSPQFQEDAIATMAGAIPSRLSVVRKYLDIVRSNFEELEDVDLEIITEILTEPGYGGNVNYFKNHNAAMEVINPAMDLVFGIGEKDPTYFLEIVPQVDATQV
jgi:multiple sugar transport system substrate-binding protein